VPIDESHPNVVRFDRKLWVSPLPADELAEQIRAQRAWDDANSRANHWPWAIGIGAAVGSVATYVITALLGAPPVINLFLLPAGFAAGAVLGGLVSERLRPRRDADAALGPRPKVEPMTRIPRRVAARADADSTAAELIELCTSGR
jgi:hypothetical protein